MKKVLVVILSIIMIFSICSCNEQVENDKPNIVCVEYFTYDWIRNILGEKIDSYNLILLNTSGKDMHSYEPSASDLVTALDSALFIYLGGMSENWAVKFLEDKEITSISLLEEFLSSEISSLYELDMDDIDEHFYLSPIISEELVRILGGKMETIFSDNTLSVNANNYADEIKKLQEVSLGELPIVVCDRYPFEYLSDDFGFDYYAAFDGCSSETEASFSVILELTNAIIENDLDRVYIIENSDAAIANQVISTIDKDIDIVTLNSIQSITDMNTSYLDVLANDINLIKDGTIKG